MTPGRLANLRTAVLVAGGFVVLRVVYRVLFGGGSGDGILLVDLPRIPLAGPFAGVLLLGPITTGGIISATVSALPFAAVILAGGLLGVVVDLRRLITRGSLHGPLKTVARALVVAWSTFPALRDAAGRVRIARQLRGERSLASLIVPVLEQTVERAIALGASMEVRGFAAGRRPEPDCAHPVVMADAALGFDGRRVLDGIDLALAPGTLVLVTGATGSGKSTLLHSLSGLFQHQFAGDQEGTVRIAGVDRIAVPPRDTAGFVGVVSQSVRLSFVASTVADELGFALAIRGVDPTIVGARVVEIAGQLGIGHLLDRTIAALSAGEACLVALGAALVSHPVVLIVDEPLADLDAAARSRVITVLDRLAHRGGVCVLVAEHAHAEWDGVVDERLELRDGHVRVSGKGAARPPVSERLPGSGLPAGRQRPPRRQVATINHLSVSYGDRLAVDRAAFCLNAGEVVALRGPNGAGKSSLLMAMARPSARGAVDVAGVDLRTQRRAARRRSIALVPEMFDDLLFTTTVAAECARADRLARRGGHRPATAQLFLGFLGADPDDAPLLLERHPRDLSAGQRMCLVIAIQLSARPRVILVDEPTRGLDADARALVGETLVAVAAGGAAVVVATHDADFAARFADRSLTMDAGRIDAERGETDGADADPVEVAQ